MTEQLLLTVKQTASALSLSVAKVYELLASGAIASVHVGRARRVPRAELERFVDQLRAEREV
jgi:excisionase family DNA binding protein